MLKMPINVLLIFSVTAKRHFSSLRSGNPAHRLLQLLGNHAERFCLEEGSPRQLTAHIKELTEKLFKNVRATRRSIHLVARPDPLTPPHSVGFLVSQDVCVLSPAILTTSNKTRRRWTRASPLRVLIKIPFLSSRSPVKLCGLRPDQAASGVYGSAWGKVSSGGPAVYRLLGLAGSRALAMFIMSLTPLPSQTRLAATSQGG